MTHPSRAVLPPVILIAFLAWPGAAIAGQAPPGVSNFQTLYDHPLAVWSVYLLNWDTPAYNPLFGDQVSFEARTSTTPPGNDLQAWFAAAPTHSNLGLTPSAGTHQTASMLAPVAPTVTVYFGMQTTYPGGVLSTIVISNTVDPGPPNATTLTEAGFDDQSITVQFAAPGEDPFTTAGALAGGPATAYEFRYTEVGPIITQNDFTLASAAPGAPQPGLPGTMQTFQIAGLLPGHLYHVAMKSRDDQAQNQWSAISNSIAIQTLAQAPEEAGAGRGGGCTASSAGGRNRWPEFAAVLLAALTPGRLRSSSGWRRTGGRSAPRG